MCLYVDRQYHPFTYISKPKPKVATFPILVYKALGFDGKRYIAPYRGTKYNFNKTYTAKLGVLLNYYIDRKRYEWYEVGEGLHACITKDRADQISSNVFYAIIPPGAEFYLGDENDIVASKLIVYESKLDLEKVWGKVRPGVPRASL